jgi:hypothetical protein
MGGAKALTADGLFIGQTNEFIELIMESVNFRGQAGHAANPSAS